MDFAILMSPYAEWVRELWNSRDRLRPLIHHMR